MEFTADIIESVWSALGTEGHSSLLETRPPPALEDGHNLEHASTKLQPLFQASTLLQVGVGTKYSRQC